MDVPSFPWLEPENPAETVQLRNVFLHVTKACNLYCKYCYFSASHPLPDEMTIDEFAHLWSQLVEIKPHKVIFTGGEPLLRPDILDLLQGLKEADPQHHVLRCLNSNGHLVTPELAKQLVGLADEVRVSLDALQERNDALRGDGNFDAAVRALETYYAVGFEPKVLVTVTAHGLPDLEELLVFLIQKKFTRINLNAFRPIGRGKKYAEWRANAQQAKEAVHRAWIRCYPDQPLSSEPPESESCINCGVGQFLNIMPNGDVFPCHVLTSREFRCGNVREQSLLEICRKQGLLGQLAELNFRDLANEDRHLVNLIQPNTCMGPIYHDTKSSPAWKNKLALGA